MSTILLVNTRNISKMLVYVHSYLMHWAAMWIGPLEMSPLPIISTLYTGNGRRNIRYFNLTT
jgi:hypothetical protein